MNEPTPLVRMIHTRNRTLTGRRTATPARKAATYIAFGRDKQAQEASRQRGAWIGPGGQQHSHEATLTWAEGQAKEQAQTFQALLSVPKGRLTAADYARALEQAGQIADFRLMVHNDTAYSHAHVLFFRDKRIEKEAYLRWQEQVRQELALAEQKQLAGQAVEQEAAVQQEESPGLELG